MTRLLTNEKRCEINTKGGQIIPLAVSCLSISMNVPARTLQSQRSLECIGKAAGVRAFVAAKLSQDGAADNASANDYGVVHVPFQQLLLSEQLLVFNCNMPLAATMSSGAAAPQ
jgi:hypothetical protein